MKSFTAFGIATLLGLVCMILFMPVKGQAESLWRNLVCGVALLFLIFGSIGTAASLVWCIVAEFGQRITQKQAGGGQ